MIVSHAKDEEEDSYVRRFIRRFLIREAPVAVVLPALVLLVR
jgi:hypothetical protein